jgi:hypothetical protein
VGQNVIELNGKRYDAFTGAYLGKSHVVPKHLSESFMRGKVIDGFVRPSHTAAAQPRPMPKAAAALNAESKSGATPPAAHRKPGHLKAHKPERAKTLMRRATVKPHVSPKPAIKPQAPAEVMARPLSAIAHKRSAYGVDPSRQDRAALTAQHHAVRHFHHSGAATQADVRPTVHHVAAIPVRPAPAHATGHTARPAHHDIFEKAMARATSHEQPRPKVHRTRSRRRRLVNSLALVAAFLIITGFVTYLNLPQLQLRVASMQAGFGAAMPGYIPTGYALEGNVEHTGGTIALRFRSGDSQFRLTQQSSNWNSQTLLDNTLALNGRHQTVQKNGQTIYIYDESTSAAWVNGGVRYDITGNAELAPQEIIDIAASL